MRMDEIREENGNLPETEFDSKMRNVEIELLKHTVEGNEMYEHVFEGCFSLLMGNDRLTDDVLVRMIRTFSNRLQWLADIMEQIDIIQGAFARKLDSMLLGNGGLTDEVFYNIIEVELRRGAGNYQRSSSIEITNDHNN